MYEALLFIWLNYATNREVLSVVPYESAVDCQTALEAIKKDPWVNGSIGTNEIKCVPVGNMPR